MTKLLAITVARKPLSEGSLAKNVLKWGAGGLNIDGARIGYVSEADRTANTEGLSRYAGTSGGWKNTSKKGVLPSGSSGGGRWPANLILEHRDGCRRAGTKKVKGSPTSKTHHEAYEGESATGFLRGVSHPGNQHADPDGTETIDAWECVPGCPVADLDEQSGGVGAHRTGAGGVAKDDHPNSNLWEGFRKDKKPFDHGDSGGASRFFKQVGDVVEGE